MNDFQTRLQKLNPQQRLAVDTTEGPVLVVAGPGTGKTEMLAMRIANILQLPDKLPESILCITFTEAGTVAMRKRLLDIMGVTAHKVKITTFHGFCDEVIQTHPEKFPQFNSNPSSLDDLTRIKIIQSILDELPKDTDYILRPFHNPYFYQGDIVSAIGNLKKEGISADQLREFAESELSEYRSNPKLNKRTGEPTQDWKSGEEMLIKNIELAEIFATYQDKLSEQNYYDYDDMIMFVVNSFTQDHDLLLDYQERFEYTLVDEYQDTNGSQNKLIMLLGSGNEGRPNIFAVGDDDQAIYRFQGANVDNLLLFEREFSDVATIPVDTNYRSSQSILDFADGVISENESRLVNRIEGLNKRLTAGTQKPNHLPQVYRFSTDQAELRFITSEVKALVDSGADYSDIAVLYRNHKHADPLIDAMVNAGIPIKLSAGGDALQDNTVIKLLNLLRVIDSKLPNRDALLAETLMYKFIQNKFGFDRLTVFKLLRFTSDQNYFDREGKQVELFDVITNSQLLEQALGDESQGVRDYLDKIVEWREVASDDVLSQFVVGVLEQSGLVSELLTADATDIDSIGAVNSFYNYIKDITRADRELTLSNLISDLELFKEYGLRISEQKLDTNENGVNLMTAHASKGLEFKYVFIYNCSQGVWSKTRNNDKLKLPPGLVSLLPQDKEERKSVQIEDDRRLFFVAATRAKDKLYITSAEEYREGANVKSKEESQFLSEVDDSLIARVSGDEFEDVTALELINEMTSTNLVDLDHKEKLFLTEAISQFKLSASALNEYLECPLKFLYNRLLKIPAPNSKHQALGSAAHFALEHLSRDLASGQELTKQKFIQDFHNSLSKQLLGGDEYRLTVQEGEKILGDYFDNYKDEFSVPAAAEHYVKSVSLEFSDIDPVILTGKIDRIDWVDKDAGIVKVTDYKTSKPVSENNIRGETKDSEGNIFRQLVFYKLLAELDPNFKPKDKIGVYRVRFAEVDFLRSDKGKFKRVMVEITDQDVQDLKVLIKQVMIQIRNLEFYNLEDYPKCSEWEMLPRIS